MQAIARIAPSLEGAFKIADAFRACHSAAYFRWKKD
jgi:hypothetical protein